MKNSNTSANRLKNGYLLTLSIKVTTIFFALIILTSCTSSKLLPRHKDLIQAYPDRGFLMGSIAVRNTRRYYDNYEIFIRKIGSRHKKKIVLYPKKIENSDFKKGTFFLDGYRGQYFVLPLPPGKYEVFDFSLYSNAKLDLKTDKSDNMFSIPFTVKKGAAYYLGELEFSHSTFLDFIESGSAKNRLRIHNKMKRDIPYLKKKYPKFNWTTLSFSSR